MGGYWVGCYQFFVCLSTDLQNPKFSPCQTSEDYYSGFGLGFDNRRPAVGYISVNIDLLPFDILVCVFFLDFGDHGAF